MDIQKYNIKIGEIRWIQEKLKLPKIIAEMKTKLEKNTRENKTQKLKKNKVTGIEKNFKESIYQC